MLHPLALVASIALAATAHAGDASHSKPCPPSVAAAAAQAPAKASVAAAASADTALADRGFAGTIVDLSCDVVRLTGGNARCDSGEHHFALRVDGQPGLRALEVAQSTPVAAALHTGTLTGKEVCVTGESSPNGVLRVTGIHPLG